MEFKLDYIETKKSVTVIASGVVVDGQDCVVLNILHNDRHYSSATDDVFYVFGKREPHISVTLLKHFMHNDMYNMNGTKLFCHWTLSNVWDSLREISGRIGTTEMYIRQPVMPVVLYIREPVISPPVIVEVEKIVPKEIYVVKEYKDLDDCSLCKQRKSAVSLGCCTAKYCIPCCVNVVKQGKCACCPMRCSFNNVEHLVIFDDDKFA